MAASDLHRNVTRIKQVPADFNGYEWQFFCATCHLEDSYKIVVNSEPMFAHLKDPPRVRVYVHDIPCLVKCEKCDQEYRIEWSEKESNKKNVNAKPKKKKRETVMEYMRRKGRLK